jgi:peptidoglycan/LPS O-acetylase OafA/YrhL
MISVSKAEPIDSLTSLRFIAAGVVVLYHTLPREVFGVAGSSIWLSIVDLGFSAVSLFFVLSGFILAKVYQGFPDRHSLIRFALARVARIVPLYLTSLLLDLPRLLAWRILRSGLGLGALIASGQLLAQCLMLHAWIPQLGGLNFPSWSVATEVFFYAAFPILLVRFNGLRVPGTLLMTLLACWALTVSLAVIH